MANTSIGKTSLGAAITAVAVQSTVIGRCGNKTYSAWGLTTAGAGAATIVIQGSNSGGTAWVTIGTISLTLGTTAAEEGFTSSDAYEVIRANVTAISGTGASVSAAQTY
jgi:hypothetical protein